EGILRRQHVGDAVTGCCRCYRGFIRAPAARIGGAGKPMRIIAAKGRLGPMTGAPGQSPDYPLRSRAQWRQRRRGGREVATQYGRLKALIVALVHGRVRQKGRWVSANIHPLFVTTESRRPDRDPLPAPAALRGPALLLRQVWPLPVPVARQSC